MSPRTPVLIAASIGAAFVAAVYVPDLGRGFIKDDCAWIAAGIEALHRPSTMFTVDSSGFFFRPLVTASFAADYAVYGANARGYGFTNLLLGVGCIAAIVLLVRELGMSPAAAAFGAVSWLINPHGIGMALLWISGRTSLLMTLCSTLSIVAFLRRQHAVGAALLLCAMFAKEDAVAVPLILFACRLAAGGRARGDLVPSGVWMGAAEAMYFLLRARTSAMTPATAPSYYQLLSGPWAIGANALSYLDRAGTSAGIVVLAAAIVYRTRPELTRHERGLLAAAMVWFLAGIAITILVPVRSDLYAVFPSIGGTLACAVIIDALRARSRFRAGDTAMAVALAAILLLAPVYRLRDARYVEPARLSAQVQQKLAADLDTLPFKGLIVLQDEPGRFVTFGDAFDGMPTAAVQLFTGRILTAQIVPQQEEARRPDETARYRLVQGQIRRVR